MISAIRQFAAMIARDVVDTKAAVLLSRYDLPYLPVSKPSLSPAAVVTVVNDILINRRGQMVEFGAGISTVYFARALQDRGGRLISFEHEEAWAGYLNGLLDDLGLTGTAQVVHAPLAADPIALDGLEWYDPELVERACGDLKVDCLLVDGPPAYAPGKARSRYPAVPHLKNRLAERYAIYLDDIARKGEQDIASRWSSLLGADFRHERLRGGFARASRGRDFYPGI